MTIQWNGHDVGLAPGMADAIEAVVGPLPYLYVVDSGLRTYQQQAADYAKGRDAAGNIVNLQAVVTYAKPGASAHNAGLAVDLYPVVNGSLDYGYSRGMPEPSPQALPSWQALWDAVDASLYLHSGRNIVSSTGQRLYDPGHIERVNWRLHRRREPRAHGRQRRPRLPGPDCGGRPQLRARHLRRRVLLGRQRLRGEFWALKPSTSVSNRLQNSRTFSGCLVSCLW